MFDELTTDNTGKLTRPEGKTLEYKRDLTHPAGPLRTLVAFANSAGGQLIVGINDDRTVRGLDDPLAEEERLTSLINDTITPQLLPNVMAATIAGKTVLIVDVPATRKPHYIRAEGLDHGVYVRLGSSTRRADTAMVAELERLARGSFFEDEPCPAASIDELDLETLSQLRNTPTSREHLTHLGLAVAYLGTLVPTNAGILAAHPHPDSYLPTAYVQLARFRGTDRLHISDHTDVHTNIPAAVEPIMDFILKHAYRRAIFGGVKRQDVYSVPVTALRELVVNALAHANYGERGTPIRLAFYDDRIEIENPGTLMPGMTIETMRYVSKLRNPSLAKIFREANLMEQWGTGLKRAFADIAEAGLPEPRIEEIVDRVRVTVYIEDHSSTPSTSTTYDEPDTAYEGSKTAYDELDAAYDEHETAYDELDTAYEGIRLSANHLTLLRYLAGGNKTRQEIQMRLGIKSTSHLSSSYLTPLLNAHLIERTLPDKPQSKNQQYRLSFSGRQLLKTGK